ncbi:uncharacterized protein [Misgurnus anguillicaudatus]|uniref:uncharacterized protein n=1 Tax=Misgurnus anguillicaudatus TaxID=75329 RepID=UPI003CCF4C52
MKIKFLFLTFSLFTNGVFGDEGKSVSVMEGDSLTLHTDITELKSDAVVVWRFKNNRIATINKEAKSIRMESDRNRDFRDHLQINNQTGDLTVRNIRAENSGVYEVGITGMKTSITKLFNVSCVSDSSSDGVKSVSVMNRDSVILHTGFTEIKPDDQIEWRFGPQRSLIASFNKTSNMYNAVWGIEDRRHLNNWNGDLTIRHIRNDTTGLYEVQIRGGRSYTIKKSFNVTISDGLKRVSVNERQSVTLWSGVKEIQRADVILWWFEHGDYPIAEINRKAGNFSTYDGDDGRFKDILQIDHQSGNLTIKNIKLEHSGLYHVDSSSSTHTLFTRFSVTVCEESLYSGFISRIFVPSFLVAVAFCVVAAVVAVIYFRHMSPKARGLLVMEGDSVTLHTDVCSMEKQDIDEMEWTFQKTVIAKIKRSNKTIYDVLDGRFRDRLTLSESESVINDTRTTDAGVYKLKIVNRSETSYKRFRLTVTGTHKRMTVNEGESYTLHTDVTDIQTCEVIEWKFGDEETLIAEIIPAKNIFSKYDGDYGLFRDRLNLNPQTGDLIINESRQEHSGEYMLKIIRDGKTSYRRCNVCVTKPSEAMMPLINRQRRVT